MALTNPELPRIRACIFDMDGLLIDSEDIYTKVTNIILEKYGRPKLPWNIKAQLQGRPAPQAGEIFREWAQLPCSREDFLAQQSALQVELFPGTKPLPGAEMLLQTLRGSSSSTTTAPEVELALATSSQKKNFKLKSDHLPGIFETYFDGESRLGGVRVLGDDGRIAPGRGKPRGDIYLLALDLVNAKRRARGDAGPDVRPEECLVFEDSVPGVEAGRRAGMRVCWCPHPGLKTEYTGKEELVLAGRTGESGLPEEAEEAREKGLKGWPSKVGDGWAAEVATLENFPYEGFGIVLKQ